MAGFSESASQSNMIKKNIPVVKALNMNDNQIFLDGHGKASVEISCQGMGAKDDLTIDVYPVENQRHPERHFGYWVYSDLKDGHYLLSLDFSLFSATSMRLFVDDIPIKPVANWLNPDLKLEPVLDFQVVLRRNKKIIRLLHFNLVSGNESDLQLFYQKGQGGIYHIDDFNQVFHEERLLLLKKLFLGYLNPGDLVLDAGSGRGIFHLLENPSKSKVTCLDLSFHDFHPRQGLHQVYYAEGSLFRLPFPDNTFNMVFSGEVIEHLPDPEAVLTHFRKILKPGGILILTTPNSDRLINRVRGFRAPLSREHISEYGKKEWETILHSTGFQKIAVKGIYLELMLSFWRGRRAADWLRSRKKLDKLIPLTRLFMKLGRVFPSLALDLVFICRKAL